MITYNATATKEYYCAFRCAYCHEMNVTKGKFSVSSSGNMNKGMAAATARLNLMKALTKFYDKVNEQRYPYKLHVDTTCKKCGRKQEWGNDPRLPKAIAMILSIVAFFLVFRLAIAPTGNLFGTALISVFFGSCLGLIGCGIVERIYAKICKNRLDANPTAECCPYVGDIFSINAAGKAGSDDERIRAILAEHLKAAVAKKAEEEQKKTVSETWTCACGQSNPASRGFCSKCGAVKP